MGDNCLFYWRKENKLEGLLTIHVDDYLSAGTEIFQKDIILKLRQKYKFRKILKNNFKYTGLHVEQDYKQSNIYVNQNEFIQSLHIFSYQDRDNDDGLNKNENKLLRKSVGQLNWASSQTRPDLAFDTFSLSTCLNKSKIKHTKYANKVIEQAKKRAIELKFQKLGRFEDLHIELYADASLGNVEADSFTKSMMGYFIVISNKKGYFNPIHWKSKIIDKVAEDIKTAETLALDCALDDSIYLSRIFTELYYGDYKLYNMPIKVNEDSKSLVDTLFSTKKVKRKTMRIIISSIQQYINRGIISDVKHVTSRHQLADAFTKKGAFYEPLLKVLKEGKIGVNP